MSASTMRVPLGRLVGARSGDKGGNANIGVWVPVGVPDRDGAYAWLSDWLTVDRVRQLIPDTAGRTITVYRLDNLHALNIVVHALLGRGVSENTLLDPQAKGLGELLRSRVVDIPSSLLPDEGVSLA